MQAESLPVRLKNSQNYSLQCTLVVMLAFGIINLLEYKSKGTTDPNDWIGFATIALLALAHLMQIRKLKKHKGE